MEEVVGVEPDLVGLLPKKIKQKVMINQKAKKRRKRKGSLWYRKSTNQTTPSAEKS